MARGNRWRDLLDDEKDIDCGPYCPGCFCPQKDSRLYDGGRIALAAAKWRDNLDVAVGTFRRDMLDAILRGEGPVHNPPKGDDHD